MSRDHAQAATAARSIRQNSSVRPKSRRRHAAAIMSLAIGAAVSLAGSHALADAIWTGASSADWNTIGNWDVDPSNQNVFIHTDSGNYPILSSNSAFVPIDVIVGDTAGNGRLDHTGGLLTLANTGASGNWFMVGRNNASGEYNISGNASLTVGKLFAGGAYFAAGGNGTININTTGTIAANSTQSVAWTFGGGGPASIAVGVGDFGSNLGTGTVNLQQGTVVAAGPIHVGSHGGTGVWNQTGGSVTAASLSLGRWRGAGTVNISNGSFSTTGFMNLLHAGSVNDLQTGTMNVGAGGVVNSEGDLIVAFAGATGSQGTLNINTGGVVNVASTVERWLIVSQWDTVNGTINVDGGTLNLNANTDLRFATGNNSGATVVNLNAGAINAWAGNGAASGFATSSVVDLNRNSANANSTFNLNGGTLTTNQVITTNDNGTVAFNFNGGTLRAAGASANFVNLGGANQFVNVLDGGAKIDTNGFDNTIPQALIGVGTGGLTKSGAGRLTLTGANTYTGATVVTGGSLVVSGAGDINASSGITVNGSGARFVANGSTAVSSTVVVTNGGVAGTGTINAVQVASNAANFVANGDGGTGVLTIGSLTFDGAGSLNFNVADTNPVIVANNVTTNGSGNIAVNASSAIWSEGTYNLLSYSNLGGSGFGAFSLGAVTGLSPRQVASLSNPSGFVALTIAGDNPRWSGAASNEWSTNAIPGAKNWRLITSGTPTDYIAGDVVLFDDTATTTNPTISVADVAPQSVLFNNSSKNYTLSGAFGITGATGLTKEGTGTLTINNANSYTGGTIVTAGQLNINNANALGSGTLTVADGVTLDNTSGSAVTLAGNAITLQGGVVFGGSNALNLGTGAITRTGDTSITVNGTAPVTIGGALTGAGAITKSGDGTLVLTGNNTNSGLTTLAGGTLQIDAGTYGSTAANIAIADGTTATLTINGGVINANRVIIAGNSDNTTTSGTGTVNMTGGTINSQQWFTVGSGTGASAGTASGTFNMSGGTLNVISQQMEVGNFNGTTGTVNLSGTGAIRIYNNHFISLGANALAAGGTFNQNGGTVTFYSDAGTTVGGNGILYLGRNGNLPGSYVYNLNGGTLTVPQISRGGGNGVLNLNGGVLKAARSNTAFISNLSSINVGAGGAIIDTNGFDVSINNPLLHDANAPAVDGGLTKNGAGVLTLGGGVSTYTGLTNINGGIIRLPSGAPPATVGHFSFDELNNGELLAQDAVVANFGTGGAAMNGLVNNNDNLLLGQPAVVDGVFGGNAIEFDGFGSSIDVASQIIDQAGSASWTMSVWVKTSLPGASILSKDSGNNAWDTGDSVFYMADNPISGNGGNLPTAVRYAGGFMQGDPSPVNVLDDQWHMITYVSNAGTKLIYVDGVPAAMTLTGFDNADTSTLVRIGYSVDTLVGIDGTQHFFGRIDELKFFNGALSAAQIASLYATNTFTGNGQQYLPTATPVNITAAGAGLDLNDNDQVIGSLAGVAGSTVALGTGTLTTGGNNASTTFAGVISGTGGLTKVGTGTFTITGANTYEGLTTVQAGTLVVGVDARGAILPQAEGSLAGLDLQGGKVIFDYAGSADGDALAALVLAALDAGYDLSPKFSAGVIRSSTLEANRILGWKRDTANSDVVVAYTVTGDTDLDLLVGFSDLLAIARNYNGTDKVWSDGDFDYDGSIGFTDLLALARNYNVSLTVAELNFMGGESFATDWALASSIVPEPATLGGLMLASLALGRRRRNA